MAASLASTALSDKVNFLDLLVGYCAGSEALIRIRRCRLRLLFKPLSDPLEWQAPSGHGERPNPPNFMTEQSCEILFHNGDPQTPAQPHCCGEVDSAACSDLTESKPFTPRLQSIADEKYFPTIVYPWVFCPYSRQTELKENFRNSNPLDLDRLCDSNRQNETSSQGLKLTDRENVPGNEPEMTQRVFPPISQQTVLQRLLYNEYCVRGLLPAAYQKKEKNEASYPISKDKKEVDYRASKIFDELDGKNLEHAWKGLEEIEVLWDPVCPRRRRLRRFIPLCIGNPGHTIGNWSKELDDSQSILSESSQGYMSDSRFGPMHGEIPASTVSKGDGKPKRCESLTESEFRERRREWMLQGFKQNHEGAAKQYPLLDKNVREQVLVARRRDWLLKERHDTQLECMVERAAQVEIERIQQRPMGTENPADGQPAQRQTGEVSETARQHQSSSLSCAQPRARKQYPVRSFSRKRRIVRLPTNTRFTPPSRLTLLEIAAQRRVADAITAAATAAAATAAVATVCTSVSSDASEEWDPGCVGGD